MRRPRLMRATVFWVVVATGAAITLISIPFAIKPIAKADAEFWILVALALVADIRPVRPPAPIRRFTTFALSPCFCFVILLLFGAPSAIVVEAVAVTTAARALRLNLRSWAFHTSRLVCAFAAAGAVKNLLGVSDDEIRVQLGAIGVLGLAIIAFTFVAVSCAITLANAIVSGATRSEVATQLRFETLARGGVVAAAAMIATTSSAPALLLLFIPVVGWAQLARILSNQDQRLDHDSVTGLLSSQGLTHAIVDLPRDRMPPSFGVSLIQLRRMPFVSRNIIRRSAEHVLTGVAQRIHAAADPGDLIGRLSDNQFVIVRHNDSVTNAIDRAENIVRTLTTPIESPEGIPFRLDPVAGVALAPQHGHDLDQLVSHAEAALTRATLHDEAVSVYTPDAPSDVDDRMALLRRLRQSLNDPNRTSEIVMVFQPQVHLDTGRTQSVEALLRWHHPEQGPIPTNELMRVVETTGLMQELTRYVLDRVAAQLAEWNRIGMRLRAAVNVSVLDLQTDDFDTQIKDTLLRHNVSPKQLDIEITERSIGDDIGLLGEAVQRVARLGIGVSLDDFGTGYASLRRLRRLPLTEIKIDRSYVSKIAHSRPDRVIVTATHDMARVLGLRLVAEGVEDEQTARVLANLGNVIGQGWYFARPMPPAQLIPWLNNARSTAKNARESPTPSAQPFDDETARDPAKWPTPEALPGPWA
ncbi:MAG TPA: GGDEF domain-containing phosphodiesterase [Micromonosporaceae bacterium]|nr:GGDEF domain-containing phosphodiesterase [Micromonosporaceae bacterium]